MDECRVKKLEFNSQELFTVSSPNHRPPNSFGNSQRVEYKFFPDPRQVRAAA